MHSADGSRPWTFYFFAAFFGLFVAFLYGPMVVIYVLSFQGPTGGMTFPLNGISLHWFDALISQSRVGDIAGSFQRSIVLAAIVAVVTVLVSVLANTQKLRTMTTVSVRFMATSFFASRTANPESRAPDPEPRIRVSLHRSA